MISLLHIAIILSSLALSLSQSQDFAYCQAPGVVQSQNTDGLSLNYVQILVRHGDRTPTAVMPSHEVEWNCTLNYLNSFSNDEESYVKKLHRLYRKSYMPGRNQLLGNCGLGQLTDKGLQQHFKLGAQFRDLYVDQLGFLPDDFNASLIWIRSTDVPRTVMSAMANFYGMYPPEKRFDGGIDILDINTMDGGYEDMFPNPPICPRLQQLYDEQANYTNWIDQQQSFSNVSDVMIDVFNITAQDGVYPFEPIWDNLGARVCHNLSLPEGVDLEIMHSLWAATAFQQKIRWTQPLESGILGSGLLLQELYGRIMSKINGTEPYLMRFYSGHDSTVGPLMALLGYFDGWPPYASHVEIELWSDSSNNYFVQFKYNGKVVKISGCSSVMCEISEFQQMAEARIPYNFEEQCQVVN